MSAEDVVVLETGSAGGAVRGTETETEIEIGTGIGTGTGTGIGTGGETKTEGGERGETAREWILTINMLGVMPPVPVILGCLHCLYFALQPSFTFS